MSKMPPVAWLTSEATDLLDAGPVGLYELKWVLAGSELGLSVAEIEEISRRVAKAIVDAGSAALFTLDWPNASIVDGPHDLSVLNTEGAWIEGSDRSYVALVPAERVT